MNTTDVHPLLRRLQTATQDLSDRQDLIRALKDFITAERKRLISFQQAGLSGFDFCKINSILLDAVCSFSLQRALDLQDNKSIQGQCGLFALGGYGRRELSLHSDVDLLLLHNGQLTLDDLEELASQTFTLLWDCGLQLGHSVRETSTLTTVLQEDIVSATSLLESRPIAAPDDLCQQLQTTVRQHLTEHWDTYCHSKFQEAGSRHDLQGGSPYITQPNCKESPGGLRDAHTCMWTMMVMENLWSWKEIAALGPLPVSEIFSAVNCIDVLLRIRNQMHILAQRKQDVLDGETQIETAQALGYASNSSLQGYELFMRDYYHAAAGVYNLYQSSLEHFETKHRQNRTARRQPVNAYLVEIDKHLYLSHDEFIAHARWPVEIMEIFSIAAKRGLQVSHSIYNPMQRFLSRIDDTFRNDKSLADDFLGILRSPDRVSMVLKAMNESEFLGEYIPEFGMLRCLVPHDPYHSYTVDEHSLQALKILDDILTDTEDPRHALLQEYEHIDMLRLSLLLHDIGKGTGGVHEESSAAMTPEIGKRLGLSDDDMAQLMFLVRHHDLFMTTAEKRTWQDSKHLSSLLQVVGNRRNWIALYLTSYCDVKAVGKRIYNKYKDAEMTEVFDTVVTAFEDCEGSEQPTTSLRKQLERVITDARDKVELKALLGAVPRRYLSEVSAEEAIMHIGLMQEYARGGAGAVIMLQETCADIWVAASDKPARFSEIAGILSAHDLHIVAAAAYTRNDGIVLDKFRVLTEVNNRFVGRRTWANIKNRLIEVMAGTTTTTQVIRQQADRIRPLQPKDGVHRPSRVKLSNKISADYSVIDITTRDRIGLLFAITSYLATANISIHYARIATRGTVVSDVFYVSRDGAKLDEHGLDKKLFDLVESFDGI